MSELIDADFLIALHEACSPDLEAAFGKALERLKWKYAVEVGQGDRSLAVIRPQQRPRLEIDEQYHKVQLRFNDPELPAYLAVTDVRFFEADHKTIRTDRVEDVSRRLQSGVEAHLMFGPTRRYKSPGDDRERHWLQVNGIVLDDRPVGDDP